MQFSPGAVVLSQITNGVLGAGTVPYDRYVHFDLNFTNPGNVSVLSTQTTIIGFSVPQAEVGDRILIFAECLMVKGGVTGYSEILLEHSGGVGTVVFYTGKGIPRFSQPGLPTPGQWHASLVAMGLVTVAGGINIRLAGLSQGSNSLVTTEEANVLVSLLAGEP